MLVKLRLPAVYILTLLTFSASYVKAQNTEIKGFANVDLRYTDDEKNPVFFLGEQDLFITSQVTDKISFLGESVFKFSPNSPTSFNVSMERLIIGYNFTGNHTLLIGKHHTPFSHWNDKYHHGRVLFPTIDRPLLFTQGLIELHTTGLAIQGLNLGDLNFGYQIMVGNGIGSSDLVDDNNFKSWTLEAHLKPKRGMKFGLTSYIDKFSSDAKDHHGINHTPDSTENVVEIMELAGGAYFRYFHKKFEILSEAHVIRNSNDSTGVSTNFAYYLYAGYHIHEKLVPYFKIDMIDLASNEIFFQGSDMQLLSIGIRYEFSYLAVAKLEYNRSFVKEGTDMNGIYFQMAVGF